MWQLKTEHENKRTYYNTATGSQSVQTMVYKDKDGNKWYGFDDLTAIPFSRKFQANRIIALYQLGLTKDDITAHVAGLKTVFKSTDVDKYEKAYANVLEFENKATMATDPVKQMSSLVCVYYTMDDEYIDAWDNALQIRKMSLLEADSEMHNFFLNRQIDLIEKSTLFSNLTSQIASQQ